MFTCKRVPSELTLNTWHLVIFQIDMSIFDLLREKYPVPLYFHHLYPSEYLYPTVSFFSGSHFLWNSQTRLTNCCIFCHMPSSYSPSGLARPSAWNATSFRHFVGLKPWTILSCEIARIVQSKETWSAVTLTALAQHWVPLLYWLCATMWHSDTGFKKPFAFNPTSVACLPFIPSVPPWRAHGFF